MEAVPFAVEVEAKVGCLTTEVAVAARVLWRCAVLDRERVPDVVDEREPVMVAIVSLVWVADDAPSIVDHELTFEREHTQVIKHACSWSPSAGLSVELDRLRVPFVRVSVVRSV